MKWLPLAADMSRPNTQSRLRSGVPATGMRTGVPPGTAGRQAAYGQSLQADVHVSDRPVTGQGMMGMRTGSQGPGRSVQDRSYFLGLFRTKVGEISDEIRSLKGRCDQYNKDSVQATQLEKTYESLLKDVREYEGQLADYNLAMDKSRSGTDPSEITDYHAHLDQRNAQHAREVDGIFERRQECESAIKEMEGEIDQERKRSEQKISELAPEKANRYRELLDQNQKLNGQMRELIADHDHFSTQLGQAEAHLASDNLRETHQRLTKSIQRMRKEKDSLIEEARTTQMDPEEARAIMLQKVKDDKNKLDALSTQLRKIEEENAKHQKTLGDLTTDLAERKSEGGDTQKYDVLFERDKEMTAFIETFGDTRDKETGDQKKIQETIAALLGHISEDLGRENNMPSQGRVKDMREDLSFKQRQLDSAESTRNRLEAELKKRNVELEKINTLDEKIVVELTSLNEKIETMAGEMHQFGEIAGLRTAADRTRKQLQGAKRGYVSRRDAIKQQVNMVTNAYEQKKSSLAENDTARAMEALENKLRHYEQSIFHLREFIETKEHETNYLALKDDCNRMIDDLNKHSIASASAAPMQQAPQVALY